MADLPGFLRAPDFPLSRGRMSAPKDSCRLTRDDMLAAAEGWVLAAVPPEELGTPFGDRFRQEAEALRGRLALPMMVAGAHTLKGDDQRRLAWLGDLAQARAGGPQAQAAAVP